MSFSRIPLPGVLAGLLVLAGALYLLQRLRVRHRRLDVVTTLFWKEALEESRARVFVRRFRHPWAYVLALGIAGCLWLSFAGARWGDDAERDTLILIDASAAMRAGDGMVPSLEATRQLLEDLPAANREVVACAASPRTLLAPGEEAPLFAARSAGLVAENAAFTLDRVLHERAAAAPRRLDVLLVSHRLPSPEALALLPSTCRVRRVALPSPEAPARTAGITGIGVAPARSGRWDRVDVLVTLEGDVGPETGLRSAVDGNALEMSSERANDSRGRELRRLFDLPAAGGTLTVSLARADGTPADDEARLVLPRRRRLRVALSPNAPVAVRRALAADPGVDLESDAAPDVVVRVTGEAFGGETPALELVPIAQQQEAFLLLTPGTRDPREVLEDVVGRLGLDAVDATGLATATGRPILLGAASADRRGFRMWDELTGPDYDLVSSRAFPLFCAAVVRWLADPEAVVSAVRSGRELVGPGTAWTDSAGRRHDPVGAAFVPPQAGRFTRDDGRALEVSLGESAALGSVEGRDDVEVAELSGRPPTLALILGLLALGLVGLDWWAHRTGRIP